VCQQGTRLTNDIIKLKITTKKSSLESVGQIIRQEPAKASGVRQPKKVDRKMIGMGGWINLASYKTDCMTIENLWKSQESYAVPEEYKASYTLQASALSLHDCHFRETVKYERESRRMRSQE
jgi:hypothetical protein